MHGHYSGHDCLDRHRHVRLVISRVLALNVSLDCLCLFLHCHTNLLDNFDEFIHCVTMLLDNFDEFIHCVTMLLNSFDQTFSLFLVHFLKFANAAKVQLFAPDANQEMPELMDKFFGTYKTVYFWLINLVAISALVIACVALERVINDENRLPPRIDGLDQAFLVGSAGGGVEWTTNMVIPAASSEIIQVNQGLNFANPLGSDRAGDDILPSDTITNFGSKDLINAGFKVYNNGTTDVVGTGVLGTIAMQSTANVAASVQLAGQIYITSGSYVSPVYPVISGLELESDGAYYGNIQVIYGVALVPTVVTHYFCSIKDGAVSFWWMNEENEAARLPMYKFTGGSDVYGTSLSHGLISFSIGYPLKNTPS